MTPVRNLLLATLPGEDLARIRVHMESVWLEQRESLFQPDGPIRCVYFPETAVISLASTLSAGAAIEVGTAGSEGMVGLTVFLADGLSPLTALAQIPGVVGRMSVETFTQLASAPSAFHQTLLRYAEAFLRQVAQTAACNATHLIEERCARWLLTTHDRVEGATFPLTHEFLALMLGVRRAGVTTVMNDFQDAGMVQCSRGAVQVLDRAKLEGASCECYGAVRAHFERLLPRPKVADTLLEA